MNGAWYLIYAVSLRRHIPLTKLINERESTAKSIVIRHLYLLFNKKTN